MLLYTMSFDYNMHYLCMQRYKVPRLRKTKVGYNKTLFMTIIRKVSIIINKDPPAKSLTVLELAENMPKIQC